MTTLEEKNFLRPREAAEYLKVSYHRLKQLTAAGTISRVHGTKTYLRIDLDRLLNGKGGESSADAQGTK